MAILLLVLPLNASGQVITTDTLSQQDATAAVAASTASDSIDANMLVYNVKRYGATGDGETDDTEAIQTAIDALGDAGGTVYFPNGEYVVSDTLEFNLDDEDNYSNIRIQGESSGLSAGGTAYTLGSRIRFTGGGTCFDLFTGATTCFNVQVRDLEVYDVGDSATYGIRAKNFTTGCVLENVSFKGFNVGVSLEGYCYYAKIDRVSSTYSDSIGIYIEHPNMTAINRCSAGYGDGIGLSILGSHGVSVTDGWYENNAGYGVSVTGTILKGVNITGNYLEKNTAGGIYVTGSDTTHYAMGGTIQGNYQVISSGLGGASLILGFVRDMFVSGNTFGSYANAESNAVRSNSCWDVVFSGNRYPTADSCTVALSVPTGQGNVIIEPGLSNETYQAAILNGDLTNGQYSGSTAYVTAGENLALKDLVYQEPTTGKWLKAQANSAASANAQGVSLGTISADAVGLVLRYGYLKVDAWTTVETIGPVYVSAATAGLATTTIPAESGNVIVPIGSCEGTDLLFFNPPAPGQYVVRP